MDTDLQKGVLEVIAFVVLGVLSLITLLLTGCGNTTMTHKNGVTTISRWRFLMTEDIGSASFDATDGSFTIDGYKSDMTKALDLVGTLVKEKTEVEKRLAAMGGG